MRDCVKSAALSKEAAMNVKAILAAHHGADDGRKISSMPVLTKDELIGLVSIGDVVKQRVGEIEQESETMRDYIRTA
jgi:hypothetical protein